jgi:hypothetical protein
MPQILLPSRSPTSGTCPLVLFTRSMERLTVAEALPMNQVIQRQQFLNRESRAGWDRYAVHRAHVMDHLTRCRAARGRRLCLLGAGNCNDLDLATLLREFREVHLVDLDGDALAEAAVRQACATQSGLHLHVADVSGIAHQLGRLAAAAPLSPAELDATVRAAATAPLPPIDAPFDVVGSTCLLTQLIDAVRIALGNDHPRMLELALTVRNRHLQMLVELTGLHGQAVLITDIVSSLTCPELANVATAALPQLVAQRIRQGDFFTGTNPAVLRAFFGSDPSTAPQLQAVQLVKPWRWDFGPRYYAVCAIRVLRRG